MRVLQRLCDGWWRWRCLLRAVNCSRGRVHRTLFRCRRYQRRRRLYRRLYRRLHSLCLRQWLDSGSHVAGLGNDLLLLNDRFGRLHRVRRGWRCSLLLSDRCSLQYWRLLQLCRQCWLPRRLSTAWLAVTEHSSTTRRFRDTRQCGLELLLDLRLVHGFRFRCYRLQLWRRSGGGRVRVARWLLQGFGMRNVLHCWLFGPIWTRRYKSARA